MSVPAVSVVMPVYNAGKYVKLAVDSILSQSLTDFELILVNDYSTDNSEEILSSYTDERIRYYKQKQNSGVVATTNKGISLSTGQYICIMHADDIAFPERLRKQKNWLDVHEQTAVVGCFISFINEAGESTGEWKDDIETVTATQIKSRMAWRNCLAHPTVMARAEVFKKYPYRFSQQSQEDYDIWLQMLADNMIIEKVPEKLLLYRVHGASITGTILRNANPFFKQFDCKKKFLQLRLSQGKMGYYELVVAGTCIFDGLMGIGKEIKKIILQK
ncbi:MAG: glycosyltransferase [Segetibacter sp.]|nr:glycosyltransferase [Segetibacter sp.]